jgi:MFS family permease
LGGRIFHALNTWGFLVVIALHGLTLLIITLYVKESVQQQERESAKTARPSLLSSLAVIRHQRIYTFLPAWFSVNALVGGWTVLIIIMLSYPNPAADLRHPRQLLYGGFDETHATLYVGMFALLFLLGMGLWMLILPRLRRTTVMLLGLGGLAVTILSLSIINGLGENMQSLAQSTHPLIGGLLALSGFGIILLSGFTPAALTQMGAVAGTLPRQRGAVMGLYSVVLAIGQLLGSILGAFFVDLKGFYGLMIFSVIMGVMSVVSVLYVRSHRHDLAPDSSHFAQSS